MRRRAGAIIHPRDRRAAARHLARTPLVVRSMAAARIALPVPARVARPRVGAEKTTEAPSSRPSVAAASARAMATRSNINSRSSHLASVVATRALPQSHHDGKTCALTTSVIAPTVAEALTEIDEAVAGGADIVELRVDFIPTLDADGKDLTAMLERCPVPCIVTYRPTWEGGQYAGEEEPRLAALWKAVELGAAYVDCELLAAERFFAAAPPGIKDASATKIILSSHDYDAVPSYDELAEIRARCVAAGADVVKIAAMVKDIVDVTRLQTLLEDAAGSRQDTIVLGMGEAGQVSRLLAAKFGSFLTFGALRAGAESAPGQPTLRQLRDLYRVPTQTRATKVMGVIGNPIAQSKSPALHNPSLAAAGVDACYVPLLVNDIEAFLKSATFGGDDYVGFSVTIPHKEAALRCCDEVDPVAAEIGAVNTLVKRPDGTFKGYNTDYVAAIDAIEAAMNAKRGTASGEVLRGKTVVVVGAGGAGRGLAFGAKFKGADVIVANRSLDRAQALATACGGVAVTLEALASGAVKGDVLANTTSVGMTPKVDETPTPKSAIAAGGFDVVFDAVYNPLETKLLRDAKEVGCELASGLDMFVGQAALQFELFTGKDADAATRERMKRAVLDSM